jgi:hypothetical protein
LNDHALNFTSVAPDAFLFNDKLGYLCYFVRFESIPVLFIAEDDAEGQGDSKANNKNYEYQNDSHHDVAAHF